MSIKMSRFKFEMPNRDTFRLKQIRAFLLERIDLENEVWIDPFARNSRFAQFTNDLNPETDAIYHMDAADFLQMLIDSGIKADGIILDPPYSPRQVKECYDGLGLNVTSADTQTSRTRSIINRLSAELLKIGGVAITFGWNSNGVGKKNGCEIEEVHLVPHGSQLNDTIITVDRKVREGSA